MGVRSICLREISEAVKLWQVRMDPGAILATDHAGVLDMSAALLAAVHAEGRLDEDAYRAASAVMTARGYRVPVLVVWAEALAYAHLDGDEPLGDSGHAGPAALRRASAVRQAGRVLNLARHTVRTPGTGARLVRQVDRSCRRLGPAGDDLVRLLAIATRPGVEILGGTAGLAHLYRVVGIVGNTAPDRASGCAIAACISMLAAVAAGHPEHAARHLDAYPQPRELIGVLTAVAQLVMTGRNHRAVELDPDDVPVAVIDPAASDDPAVALAYELVDARNDRQRLDCALAAVDAASEHDVDLIAWYLATWVGAALGSVFARFDQRTVE